MSGRFTQKAQQRDAEDPAPGSKVQVTAMRSTSFQASERRLAEKRERRHREQAVTAWLRSLDRAG